MGNIGEILFFAAEKYPHRAAVIFGDKKLTYSHLNLFASNIARGLKEIGIKQGDRAALLLDNSPHFILSYFAILKAGAVVVPINHMFKEEEISYILSDSGAKLLITSLAYIDIAIKIKQVLPVLENILSTSHGRVGIESIYKWAHHNPSSSELPQVKGENIAVILYTSGTTGRPKGAMLTHANLASNISSCKKVIHVTKNDRVICLLPLFHSFAAMVCMLLPFYVGAEVVLMKSPRPFRRAIRIMRKNKVTVFIGIPSFYNILADLKLSKRIRIPDWLFRWLIKALLNIRVCISGAAALPVSVWEKFQKKFGIPLLEGYGLTEASPVVSLNPYRGKNKPGSVGLPLEGVEIKIANERGEELKLGEVGEILVKGANVMSGYFNRTQDTKEVLKDGWLYTGDLGRLDSEGYIYIAGRKKEMINVRGLNVYPSEIEEVLYRHPGILEAAVIGILDYHKGEVPKGFAVLKEGAQLTQRELIHYLRQHLADYKIPRHIEFRDSLPKNSTGKIFKRVLIEEEYK